MFPNQFAQKIDDLKAWTSRQIRQAITRFMTFSFYSNATASGNGDSVLAGPNDTDGAYQVRRMQHYGFRSVPPAGVAAVRLGDPDAAGNACTVAEDSDRYGPSDLEGSEVAVYGVNGAIIKIDSEGNVTVTPAPNKNVSVEASGTGEVQVSATAVTGAVKLGPVGTLAVLVQGTVDSLGVPVTQNPAASATIVKAG